MTDPSDTRWQVCISRMGMRRARAHPNSNLGKVDSLSRTTAVNRIERCGSVVHLPSQGDPAISMPVRPIPERSACCCGLAVRTRRTKWALAGLHPPGSYGTSQMRCPAGAAHDRLRWI